ncbi:hypothetical protein [Candidatus Uabimicrobium amorphum]|uniref:PEP-CTERM protein-sorting domain-containing protein n=1 Tax=Uabimicrobium amorphum TaxID=2596890 RepID=A0A5S9F173_UABAM|nr:hypothetical protein [Candidatus Uabimicrobium amorphum]BBM82355.1 hypothetical protein UABAM_00698 [Candidatus Uabimicrobium amorphum]
MIPFLKNCCALLFLVTFINAQPIIILDTLAFDNTQHSHIDFEAGSGQNTTAGINTAIASTGATFSLSQGSINPGSPFQGLDGGPVSGVGHIAGGAIVFNMNFAANPVDAVGFFLGGLTGPAGNIVVTFVDNTTLDLPVAELTANGVLPPVGNGAPGTNAINGFIGVDANGGSLIKSIDYSVGGDLHSIDDIFFGDANSVATGSFNLPTPGLINVTNAGDQFFPENTLGSQSSTTLPTVGGGAPEPPAVPEPATYFVFAIFGLFTILKLRKK